MLSPTAPTVSTSVLTPFRSMSTSLGGWPTFMMSDLNSTLPSPTILKMIALGPPAASSMPTVARKRSLPPPRSIHTMLLAWVPTPWAKRRPAKLSGFSRMERSIWGVPQPCSIFLKSRELSQTVSAPGALRRRRQEQDHYEPRCCNSHRDFLPSFAENNLSDISPRQET